MATLDSVTAQAHQLLRGVSTVYTCMTLKRKLLALAVTKNLGGISVLPSILKGYWPSYPFGVDFSLKWDGSGAKTIDVDTSPTQNMLSQYAFIFRLGRTLGILSAFDSINQIITC